MHTPRLIYKRLYKSVSFRPTCSLTFLFRPQIRYIGIDLSDGQIFVAMQHKFFLLKMTPTLLGIFFMFAMYRSSLYRDTSSFAIIQNTTRGLMEKNTGGVCYKCSPFLRQLGRIGIEMRPIFSHNTRVA